MVSGACLRPRTLRNGSISSIFTQPRFVGAKDYHISSISDHSYAMFSAHRVLAQRGGSSLVFPALPRSSLVFPDLTRASLLFPELPSSSQVFPGLPCSSILLRQQRPVLCLRLCLCLCLCLAHLRAGLLFASWGLITPSCGVHSGTTCLCTIARLCSHSASRGLSFCWSVVFCIRHSCLLGSKKKQTEKKAKMKKKKKKKKPSMSQSRTALVPMSVALVYRCCLTSPRAYFALRLFRNP